MYLAHRVSTLLHRREVDYETIAHPHARYSRESAELAHVAPERVAKGVLFRDDGDFLLAIVPTSCRVDEDALSHLLQAKQLDLAEEADLPFVFTDCERGAIPPIGEAYGLNSVIDPALLAESEVYFEGGDHEHLVKVRGEDFRKLLSGVRRGRIAYPD